MDIGDFMTPKILSREEYYMLCAYFLIASQAQREVRKHTKLMQEILKEGHEADSLSDAVYDSQKESTKKEFDELLSKLGITIEWKSAQNIFSKQQRQEEKHIEQDRKID